MTQLARKVACVVGSSITCPTQMGRFQDKPSHPDGTLLDVGKVKRHWFGRTDADALLDPGLHSDAKVILGILSLKTLSGGRSSIGVRALGRFIGKGRSTVQRRIADLVVHGDIRIGKTANGQRSWYELTSPVFAGKGIAQTPAKPAAVPTERRSKPSVICPRCRQPRGGLLRVGHCRSCNLDLKLDRKVMSAVDIRLAECAS